MDRVIVYPSSLPRDVDILQPQRNAEIALGMVMRAAFGTGTVIDGLAVTQQASPNMTVQVGQGAIITQTVIDPTGVAFGSLALDSSTNLVKVGVNTAPVNMSALTAPSTAGQSQNWLIEAQFLEADDTPSVLAYYNASNPTLPYTGPANAGTSQNTRRKNTVQLQWKAGTAAATGQQNTPTPDTGWTGVAIVTVANGQATITNANITPYSAAPFVPTKLSQQRTKLTAALNVYVSTFGNDSNNSGLSASSPFLTLQRAWTYIIGSLDLNGFNVTVNVANGTYTGGLSASGAPPGLGSGNIISFVGNTTTPSSCVISTTNAHCIYAQSGANIAVSGFQLAASGAVSGGGAHGIFSTTAAAVTVTGAMVFGACSGYHLYGNQTGLVSVGTISYTVNGAAAAHFASSGGGSVISVSTTITVSGTPAITNFATAGTLSLISVTLASITGSTTGTKYSITTNSVLNTNGGYSAFPGTAGSSGTGGQVL